MDYLYSKTFEIIIFDNILFYIQRLYHESDEMFFHRILYIKQHINIHNISNNKLIIESLKYINSKYNMCLY